MVSPKNPVDPVYSTRYQRFFQGDYTGCPPDSSNKKAPTWTEKFVTLLDSRKIITELSVRRSDHPGTGGDREGARVPPG